jgi:hypothetical protein
VHGGIGRATTLDDMRAIPKGISQYQNVLLAGMMWADPCERPGYVIVLFSIPPRVSLLCHRVGCMMTRKRNNYCNE